VGFHDAILVKMKRKLPRKQQKKIFAKKNTQLSSKQIKIETDENEERPEW